MYACVRRPICASCHGTLSLLIPLLFPPFSTTPNYLFIRSTQWYPPCNHTNDHGTIRLRPTYSNFMQPFAVLKARPLIRSWSQIQCTQKKSLYRRIEAHKKRGIKYRMRLAHTLNTVVHPHRQKKNPKIMEDFGTEKVVQSRIQS
jgi:hypothetical protein